MVVSLWSLKGGVGCSVTAALLALQRARHDPGGVVLVDLGGDQPRVLGCPQPLGPGATDWLNLGEAGPPDGIARLATDVAPGLGLVWRGNGTWPDSDYTTEVLLRQLSEHPGLVIVDAGCVLGDSLRAETARLFAAQAGRSILVTRACLSGSQPRPPKLQRSPLVSCCFERRTGASQPKMSRPRPVPPLSHNSTSIQP